MIPKWKLFLWIGLALTIIGLVIAVVYYHNKAEEASLAEKQATIELQRLKDGVVRSESNYVTKKELDKLAKNSGVDLKPIEKDIKKLGAEVKGLSTVVAKTRGFSGDNIASTDTEERDEQPEGDTESVVECSDGKKIKCPNPDKYGYLSKKQKLELNEPFGDGLVKWGEVSFSAWEERPWGLEVEPRSYSSVTVLSVDENGRHHVHNQLSIEVDGERETIEVTDAQFSEVYPKSKFRFDPRLYLGVDGGLLLKSPLKGQGVADVEGEVVAPNLQLTLFSKGKTKARPDLTFVGVGAGYGTMTKTLSFTISPVNYNIGNNLPLIENLYIGPTISLDVEGNVGILGGLKVGL